MELDSAHISFPFNDDLGTPPTRRPYSWKNVTRELTSLLPRVVSSAARVSPRLSIAKLDLLLLLLHIVASEHTQAFVNVLNGFVVDMEEPVDGGIGQIVQLQEKHCRLRLQRRSRHIIAF